IAKEQDLITADKKDSQGLCFIGKVRLPDFLQQQLKPKKGDILVVPADLPQYAKQQVPAGVAAEDLDQATLDQIAIPEKYYRSQGKKIAEHNGAHYYTVGQRKGLHVGGTGKPLFVIATDTVDNIIYTGLGEDHPDLITSTLLVPKKDIHRICDHLQYQNCFSACVLSLIIYKPTYIVVSLVM